MFYTNHNDAKLSHAVFESNNLIKMKAVSAFIESFLDEKGLFKDASFRKWSTKKKWSWRHFGNISVRTWEKTRDMDKADIMEAGQMLQSYLEEQPIEVLVYDFGKKSKNVLASVKGTQKDSFNLNKARINRSVGSLCGSLFHESCHSFDNLNSYLFIGHIPNARKGNEFTIPYALGSHVKKLIINKS